MDRLNFVIANLGALLIFNWGESVATTVMRFTTANSGISFKCL